MRIAVLFGALKMGEQHYSCFLGGCLGFFRIPEMIIIFFNIFFL